MHILVNKICYVLNSVINKFVKNDVVKLPFDSFLPKPVILFFTPGEKIFYPVHHFQHPFFPIVMGNFFQNDFLLVLG